MPNIEKQQKQKSTMMPNIELFNIWYYSWFLFVAAVLYLTL
jgi:hypothetical protein